MDPRYFGDVYGPAERAAIERHVRIAAPPMAAADVPADLLADVEVLVTGWGGPRLDADFSDLSLRHEVTESAMTTTA
jgi:hypothetical protein